MFYNMRCGALVDVLQFFLIWQKWTEGKMKKNLFPQCFIHCQYCTFDAIYLQRKKQSQLLFSIFDNYSIYKLFRVTNIQTHTHSQTHTSTCILISGLYWMLVKAMNTFRAHDQKRETHFPCSHTPSGITFGILPSISSCRAHSLYRVKVISFYNLFWLKL